MASSILALNGTSETDTQNELHSSFSRKSIDNMPAQQDTLHSLKRLTTRADIVRQHSASLLRRDVTPSLLRKISGINLFPEQDETTSFEEKGIILFYVTGWETPFCHYTSTYGNGHWTVIPGIKMERITDSTRIIINRLFNNLSNPVDPIWSLELKDLSDLEFVMCNGKDGWDKAMTNQNYKIFHPGQYLLQNGELIELRAPPGRPALLRTEMVQSSRVVLSWNAPIIEVANVSGYKVFRDNELIATLDENTFRYEDINLLGLSTYKYVVRAFNSNGIMGNPSEEIEVMTGEPEKPGAVENLRVSNYSRDSVELTWQKPTDFGGAPIETYRIYRDGTLIETIPYTANTWEVWCDTKVEKNLKYIYHITACYLVGTPGREDNDNDSNSEPILPEPPSHIIKDTQKLTDYLQSLIQGRRYEGRVSQGVEAETILRIPMPRLNDQKTHVLLQGFNWDSCHSAPPWYTKLEDYVKQLEDTGITMLWLPPPTSSVSPQGYMPTRWHDLNTNYGTGEQLRSLINQLKSHGITAMLDFVANHRCGIKQDERGEWTIFDDPHWESWAIVSNNIVGYKGLGAADTGAQSECAPDLDHTNNQVRQDTKEWINWLFKDIGFGAIRIDMAPGYNTRYQVEYVNHLGNPFAVGEYWSGDTNALINYTNACRGLIAAYDFALYYVLRRCIESGDFSELSWGSKLPGLIGKDPLKAVTFIDNHDTCHLNFVGRFAGGNSDAVLRGLVYLLTHPGTPCIFIDHFLNPNIKEQLAKISRLRHQAQLTSQCGVYIAAAHSGLYAAYISRDRFCNKGSGQIAMKLGASHWSPEGSHWKTYSSGHDFCVWSRV